MPPGGLADVPRVFVPAPPTPPASPVVVVPPAGLAGPAGPAQGAPTAAAASPAQRLLQIHGPSGALLRAAREAKQLSIQQISDTTRINARLIAALEEEDYAALPSTTQFVRGYVRQVAQLLELDAERVVVGYMRRFSGDV
jgi:hypothetical protein